MTHRLQAHGRNMLAMLTIVLLAAFTLSSCTKKKEDSNDGAKFVGTWAGTSTCASGASNLVLSAGSDGKTVTMAGTVGDASCTKSITFNLTASGNNLSGNQTFTDNCGNSYTFSASGAVSGNSLTLNIGISGALSVNCNFTGTK